MTTCIFGVNCVRQVSGWCPQHGCIHNFDKEKVMQIYQVMAEAKPGAYVDKTGTADKPDPLRDVYLEFPLAMLAISAVTAYGATKHAPRGWQTFEREYALNYHRSKMGRHLLGEETEGPINHKDGDLLHAAQATWNMLAYLEHFLKGMKQQAEEDND